MHTPTTSTIPNSVVLLPLDSIAMDTGPLRQIRPISEEGVSKLMDETDSNTWDPIFVRPYPMGEPYPIGEEGRPYQLAAGYHRNTAARRLGLTEIRAIIRDDIPDDKAFLLLALSSNLRHGQQMTRDDQIAVLRQLREAEHMSEGDLAKATGIPKGTIHTWLSGRDTNAGRSVRNAPAIQRSDGVAVAAVATVAPGWHAEASGGELLVRKAGSVVSDFLAGSPDGRVAGADVAAWVETLSTHERDVRLQQATTAVEWLGNLRAVLMNAEEASHGTHSATD